MKVLAWALNFKSVDELETDLGLATSTNKDIVKKVPLELCTTAELTTVLGGALCLCRSLVAAVLPPTLNPLTVSLNPPTVAVFNLNTTQVMQFHVHPTTIYTRASIPPGRTALKTLLPNYLQMVRSDDDDDSGRVEVKLYANEDEKVRSFNLTFDGAYSVGDPFIVHAIGMPLLPPDVNLVLDDDGPRCGIVLPEVVVSYPDVADCGRVLAALSINVTGATVVRELVFYLRAWGFDEVCCGQCLCWK